MEGTYEEWFIWNTFGHVTGEGCDIEAATYKKIAYIVKWLFEVFTFLHQITIKGKNRSWRVKHQLTNQK